MNHSCIEFSLLLVNFSLTTKLVLLALNSQKYKVHSVFFNQENDFFINR